MRRRARLETARAAAGWAADWGRWATTRTTWCPRCDSGFCQCSKIATRDYQTASKNNTPRVCGARYGSGGDCRRTLDPGETCPRDHARM